MTWSRTGRRLFGLAMFVVFVSSTLAWYATRETLPREIRIATATRGSLYFEFASSLSAVITHQTGKPVRIIETEGSRENRELLVSGAADLALMEGGSVSMNDLAIIAPVYREIVHLVARRDRGITSVTSLAGKRVALGPSGAGGREDARKVLSHYRVDIDSLSGTERYFTDLQTDESLDAAVVTTGLLNPDLTRLLATGEFHLIPILDAAALSVRNRFFSPAVIPRGFFAEGPPVPAEELPTVATIALLAAREDVTGLLVKATLTATYASDLRFDFPLLIPESEIRNWSLLPLHEAARRYYEPYEGIDLVASFVESLAALKELFFALGAGLYLAWDRWRRLEEKEKQTELRLQKEHLDSFLDETVRIERAQIDTEDPAQLKRYLDEVTLIKLKGLEELSHELLRGDPLFLIFLTQCSNLIGKIQAKIELSKARGHRPGVEAG